MSTKPVPFKMRPFPFLTLDSSEEVGCPAAERLELPDAVAYIYRGFLTGVEKYNLTCELDDLSTWEYRDIVVAGKKCKQHRQTCSMTDDPERTYHYSGIGDEISPPFTRAVDALKTRVGKVIGFCPNYCLLNRYNNGSEVVGWHSDKTTDLKEPHFIASISLGATRRFEFRRRSDHVTVLKLDLRDGDMVVMAKDVQKLYHHRIAPNASIHGQRYNLTFREAKGVIGHVM